MRQTGILPAMSKQMQIIIGVAVAALVIGVLAFTQLKKSPQSPQPSVTQEQPAASASTTTGSIKSLLGIGKNQTCKVTYPDGKGKGTIYIADKKMRGDFTMTVNSKETESHMIQDGDVTYFWSGTQGTKMKIDESLKASASPTAGGQSQGADLNKDVDMKCSSWSVDNSMFTAPSDVKFTDLSETMMKMPQNKTGGSSTSPSSYCDQITDPAAKAACIPAGQ